MNPLRFLLLPLALLVAAALTGGFEFPSEEKKEEAASRTPDVLSVSLQSSAGNPFALLNETDEYKQLSYGYPARQQLCRTFDNQYGYCIWLTSCQGIGELLYQGLFPAICSWTSALPIVCCPSGSYPGPRPGQRPYPRPYPPSPTVRPTYPDINQICGRRRFKRSAELPVPENATIPLEDEPADLPENLKPIVDKWKESYSSSDPSANAVILQDEKLADDLEERFFLPPRQGTPNRQSLKPNENPWLVSIGYYESQTSVRIVCEGIIISRLYVLTAAHCTKVRISIVRMGHTNLFTDAVDQVNVLEVQVERVEVHSKYIFGSPYYDIAVVRLQQKLTFTERITAVCLPRPNFQASDSPYSSAVSYGDPAFGDKTDGSAQELTTKALGRNSCLLDLQSQNQDFLAKFPEGLRGLLCVPETRQAVSKPNSRNCKLGGSPLLGRDTPDSPVFVTGLLIEGSTCISQSLAGFQLYTDVAQYQDFLQSFVQEV